MDGWVELKGFKLRPGSSDAAEAARPLLQQHQQATKWRLRTCSRLVAPPPEPVRASTPQYDAVLSSCFSSSPLAAPARSDVVVLVCLHVSGARRLISRQPNLPPAVGTGLSAGPSGAAATGWSGHVTNRKNTSPAEEQSRESDGRSTHRQIYDCFIMLLLLLQALFWLHFRVIILPPPPTPSAAAAVSLGFNWRCVS